MFKVPSNPNYSVFSDWHEMNLHIDASIERIYIMVLYIYKVVAHQQRHRRLTAAVPSVRTLTRPPHSHPAPWDSCIFAFQAEVKLRHHPMEALPFMVGDRWHKHVWAVHSSPAQHHLSSQHRAPWKLTTPNQNSSAKYRHPQLGAGGDSGCIFTDVQGCTDQTCSSAWPGCETFLWAPDTCKEKWEVTISLPGFFFFSFSETCF